MINVPGGMSSDEDEWDDDYFTFPKAVETDNLFVPSPICLETELIQAVTNSDIVKVQEYLLMGADVNFKSHGNKNSVIEASSKGHYEILKLLLDRGADVNSSHERFTPILAVCGSSNKNEEELLSCLELVLARRAEVNSYDWCRVCPLTYAIRCNHYKLINKLIESGAEVNCVDNDGRTPIFYAVELGNCSVVSLLKNSGSDIYVVDKKGIDLIQIAEEKGFSDILKILLGDLEAYKAPVENSCQFFNAYKQILGELPHKYDRLSGFRQDVFDILNGAKLSHLSKCFKDKEITLGCLLTVDDCSLRNIGVNFNYERRKILNSTKNYHEYSWSICCFGNTKPQNLDLYRNAELMLTVTKQLHIISITSYWWIAQGGIDKHSKIFSDSLKPNLKTIRQVRSKLKHLHILIKKIDREYNTTPSDLILPFVKSSRWYYKYFMSGLAISSILLCYKFILKS